MPSSLLKSAPTQVNHTASTTRVFSTATGVTSTNGGATLIAMATVPDGSGESLLSIRNNAANAGIGCTLNLETRLYSGRFALAVYLDDFHSDSSQTVATASTSFHQLQLSIAISNDTTGYDNSSFFYNALLTRGWNVIPLSRAYAANVARNVAATLIQPTIGGMGTLGLSSGASVDGTGTPAFASSMYDTTLDFSQLRLFVPSSGSGLFTRLFFKEIVDDYQADSKTCLIFDDARDTVYTVAYPLMRSRGLVGTLPIISSFVGTPGYMTVAQINELFRAGWDIVNHTRSHLPAATMAGFTQAQCLAEILECDLFIQANGWNRNNSNKYFVAPFGGMQQMNAVNYRAAILEAGCVASFGTTNRCIGGQLLSPYFIPRLDFNTRDAGTGYAIGTMVDQYTNAVMNGASPMVMLHQFVNVPTDSTMLAALELETFLDRVQTLELAGFTSVEGVTTAIPALTQGTGTGIRNLR